MTTVSQILVVLESAETFSGTDSKMPIELEKALRFVKDKSSTSIKLFSVVYEKYLDHDYYSLGYDHIEMRQKLCDKASEPLAEMTKHLSNLGYDISYEVRWGHPRTELIVAAAQDINADLVVQHCRADGKIENITLTNDSWQLVRQCPIPLLLVKDNPWNDSVMMIAAVDPMHSHHKPLALDNLVVDTGLAISDQLGGKLHIAHAYSEAERPFAVAGAVKEEHKKAFIEFLSSYDHEPAQTHLICDSPVMGIQELSDELNSDIVVLGGISRSRLSEALIGSTAEKLLDYVARDLLVVKPTTST